MGFVRDILLASFAVDFWKASDWPGLAILSAAMIISWRLEFKTREP